MYLGCPELKRKRLDLKVIKYGIMTLISYDISSLFVTRGIVEIAIEELYKHFPHE